MHESIVFLPDAHCTLFRICLRPSRQEHVGLLLGRLGTVEHVIALKNLRPAALGCGFSVAKQEIETIREQHPMHTVLGRYHTHPNAPAQPSNSDIRSLPNSWCEVIVRLLGRWQAPQLAQIYAYRGVDERIGVTFQDRAA